MSTACLYYSTSEWALELVRLEACLEGVAGFRVLVMGIIIAPIAWRWPLVLADLKRLNAYRRRASSGHVTVLRATIVSLTR